VNFTGDTTIGAQATITGRMGGEDLQVLGAFDGEISVRGTLRIGPQGRVKGIVKAATVEVRGTFDGEIGATTLVFGDTARARGTFRADKLSIQEGAVVDGSINGPERPKTAPVTAPAPTPARTET
jgi:cytoskeletal protein CcmA (bactofilin family)